MNIGTSSNRVFAVRFAHQNAFGTSQTRKTLCTSGKKTTKQQIDIEKEILKLK